jgi:hypothetical protein
MRQFVFLTMALSMASSLCGRDAAPPDARQVLKDAAARYALQLGGDAPRELKFRETPVFRWSNPVQGSPDGAAFVWTDHGRPAAVLGIFPDGATGTFVHEFQSLASGPLTATRGGETAWSPESAGITFAPIPEAPKVAATEALRLTQMKQLVRQFSATFLPWAVTDDAQRLELRLLAQPLDRYKPETADREWSDGAIFAFAQGTDPQALVLIEARKDGASFRWEYAFARLASGKVTGRLEEREVWSVARHDFREDAARPYLLRKGQR